MAWIGGWGSVAEGGAAEELAEEGGWGDTALADGLEIA